MSKTIVGKLNKVIGQLNAAVVLIDKITEDTLKHFSDESIVINTIELQNFEEDIKNIEIRIRDVGYNMVEQQWKVLGI